MDCINCGYMWADLDEDGTPINLEYCHFDGLEGWAPCEHIEYDEYAELAEMEQAIYDEDYRSSVEYYGEPYDYQEF